LTDIKKKEVVSRTLASRLSEGRMPVDEALHNATLLGEALRQIHESGKVHGAVSPETILLTGNGLELMPASGSPEVPDGVAADIFGFGAVLCEMLTSPKVLRGGNSLGEEPAENPAVDRLIAGCLTKDSAGRLPSMQKALLELKLASLSTRHAGAATTRKRDLDAALDAGIQESEARQDARIKEQVKTVAEKQEATTEALSGLRAEFTGTEARLTAIQQTAANNAARLEALEETVTCASRQIAMLEARLAGDLHQLEQEIKSQTAVIGSVRASMAQTDDLVGRVVEAVEAKLAAAHQSAEDNSTRLDALEHGVNSANRQNATFDSRLAEAIRKFDRDIEVQTAIVENVRTSMAQTDDLVGRVVEAVEGMLLDLGTVRR
jgi:hypothetical protein